MKKFRTLVEKKLNDNGIKQKDLLKGLREKGYHLDATELSRAVTGARQDPKSERIREASLEFIEEYEKKKLERLLKLYGEQRS